MNRKYGQAGRPTGLIGRLFGQVMAWHNQPDNEWTLEVLGVSGSDDLLEVGYGPGKAIQLAHTICPKCQIVGVDHSEEMMAVASRLNREGIAAGKVDLRVGDVEALNLADGSLDKAFSINCIYFWPDASRGLQELRRVLKVGGRLAITVRDKKREAYRPFNGKNLREMLSQAGFSRVEIHSNGSPSHPLLCAVATK